MMIANHKDNDMLDEQMHACLSGFLLPSGLGFEVAGLTDRCVLGAKPELRLLQRGIRRIVWPRAFTSFGFMGCFFFVRVALGSISAIRCTSDFGQCPSRLSGPGTKV